MTEGMYIHALAFNFGSSVSKSNSLDIAMSFSSNNVILLFFHFLKLTNEFIKHFSYSLQLFLIDLTIQLLTHIVTERPTESNSRRIKKVKAQDQFNDFN